MAGEACLDDGTRKGRRVDSATEVLQGLTDMALLSSGARTSNGRAGVCDRGFRRELDAFEGAGDICLFLSMDANDFEKQALALLLMDHWRVLTW